MKATTNERKHGINFAWAARVFFDKYRIERHNGRDNYGEDRFVTVGLIDAVPVGLAYTMRDEVVRIISARKATRDEQSQYRSNRKIRPEPRYASVGKRCSATAAQGDA